ncbi:hypothetical protein GCM10017783_23710 [Deinococcus piscis]|uniref:Uncharacterized protein n=1 Tax=Deinococcus piscis TaxID=394230 RepID=A0ABQ3KD94_9DEIO|nr:hypothetical protein [Deinococcus piscis]GHG10516.1 hypothetical protein GCM10017783_23710 [Deinococcus piscis]
MLAHDLNRVTYTQWLTVTDVDNVPETEGLLGTLAGNWAGS